MNPDEIIFWIKRRKQTGSLQNLAMAGFALLAGTLVLFLTFWFTYFVILIGWEGISALSDLAFGKRLHLSHELRLICSGAFLVLLFGQHFRTRPDYWGEYPKRHYTPSYGMLGGLITSFGAMLAYPGASANMITDLLLSGPRLVSSAWAFVVKARSFRHIDEKGCAQLLVFLYRRVETVPYQELKEAGWEEWLGQLRCLDGVQFLPKGLHLSEELRKELGEFKLSTKAQHAPV